jgi:thiol-disulfide isomerase/thioredoxin
VRFFLAGTWLFLSCTHAIGDTDFRQLSDRERAIFRAEIRAALLDLPDIISPEKPPLVDLYGAEIARDQELIRAQKGTLFSPDRTGFGAPGSAMQIALFLRPDCPDCITAEADLRILAERYDVRVTVIDVTKDPDLAQVMGIDTLPFYTLPRLMLRGAIPLVVMEKYLSNGTGQ